MGNTPRKQIIRSIINYLYLYPYSRIRKRKIRCEIKENHSIKTRVAFICDEMTWVDYSDYVTSIFLHPSDWKSQIDEFKPDLLFCESTWNGIDRYRDCWRGRIYKDQRLLFENRKDLFAILAYCKENHIKTVFWNKEDPSFFGHPVYDFSDTALHFDYIFTTAIECIDRYKALGHKKVYLLPFGVNTKLFNPQNRRVNPGTVIFAGTWFADQPQRCADLEAILDYVIAKGWKLDIYDRKSESRAKRFHFPAKYAQYLHPAVPYTDIPELCKNYEYAINVNTVTESETMFSRRLVQMIACGVTVISNYSLAISAMSEYLRIDNVTDHIVKISVKNEGDGMQFSTEKQIMRVIEIVNNLDCYKKMGMN